MESNQNTEFEISEHNNGSKNEPQSIIKKKVKKNSTKISGDVTKLRRRIFYKISDQVFESLFLRFDYLEKEKLNKEMFLMDNTEEIYLKNKSKLNKVNYIKFLYN